jgi:hypothetical protein
MTVVATYMFNVKAGRLQESVSTARESLGLLEKLGAQNARLLTPAGGNRHTLLVLLEFPSMLSYGEFVDHTQYDPAIRQLSDKTLGPDAPNELPTHEVYTQLAP